MTQSPQEIRQRIAELTELIQSAVKRHSSDGTSTDFDLAEARKERDNLRAMLPETQRRRPIFRRINLGG